MSPVLDYAQITEAVSQLVASHGGNDKSRAAYMVARAALLRLREFDGSKGAARRAYAIADELAVMPK